LEKLGVSKNSISRLDAILQAITSGWVHKDYQRYLPEFNFNDIELTDFELTISVLMKLFIVNGQSSLSSLYKVSEFKPSEYGSSSQLIVLDSIHMKKVLLKS